MGALGAGAGGWVGHDLLATPGEVAPGRGLAAAARGCWPSCTRPNAGLVPSGHRLLAREGRSPWLKSGPSPVDRRPPGLEAPRPEGAGIPLSVLLTGGNRNDVAEPEALIDAIPPVRGCRGRPRPRPDELYGDRAYDRDKYRKKVRAKGIRPLIARRGRPHTAPVWASTGG